MNGVLAKGCCALAAVWVLAGTSIDAAAEVFYAGQTKGLPGDVVELTINARANTFLEGIDIVPDIDGVASVLHLIAFTPTAALTDGGSPLCTPTACSVTYVTGKTFAADAVLASLRFTIDPAAAVGPIAFNAGVIVGVDDLPIPAGKNFEVLAVPEPSSWLMFVLGLFAAAGVVGRRALTR